MDDAKNQTSDSDKPVSVKSGGVESEPVKISTETKTIHEAESSGEQAQSTEVEPQLSEEVKDYIQVKKDFPEVDQAAKDAGVSESGKVPVYGNLPVDQNIAQQTVKTGDVNKSDPWRALIAVKEFAKGLLGLKQPQEVQ